MRIFKSNDKSDLIKMLDGSQPWKPGDVFFLFSRIMEEIKLEKPEPFMIMWQGVYFLVPGSVVENAMDREATLTKHSEHYTKGDRFTPTVITLSQCEALSDEAVHMMSRVKFYPD